MVGRKESLVSPWDHPKRMVDASVFPFRRRAGARNGSVARGFYLLGDPAISWVNQQLMQSLLGVTGVQVHLQARGQWSRNI